MTGLTLGHDNIIEIATIITDQDLNPLDPEGFERVVHCSEERLEGMGQWCREQHAMVTSPLEAVMIVVWSNSARRGLEKLNTIRRAGIT